MVELNRRDILRLGGLAALGTIVVACGGRSTPESGLYDYNPMELDNLKKDGLGEFITFYADQGRQIDTYGSPVYPLFYNELRNVARLGLTRQTKHLTGEWGAMTPGEVSMAVESKVDRIGFDNFGSTELTKKALLAIGTLYPGLVLAMPGSVINADHINHLEFNNTHVKLIEIFPNEDEQLTETKISIFIHELSHAFGGDFLDMNIVGRINEFIPLSRLTNFLVRASEASEKYLLTTSTISGDTAELPMSNLRKYGLSALTSQERTVLAKILSDGHTITVGREDENTGLFSSEVSPQPMDFAYEQIEARRALIELVSRDHEVMEDDTNMARRVMKLMAEDPALR